MIMDKEIQKMSVAIAVFDSRLFYGHTIIEFGANTGNLIPEMKYHTSWDWLMPVVEKIERENYGVKMCRKVVEIYHDDTKEVIIKYKDKSRIDSLFIACYQFIEWYNNQQTKAA